MASPRTVSGRASAERGRGRSKRAYCGGGRLTGCCRDYDRPHAPRPGPPAAAAHHRPEHEYGEGHLPRNLTVPQRERPGDVAGRAAGAATGTINRETSALHRMGTLAVHWGWLDTVPGFPDRLRENPPRQGFFEHPEHLAVRAHLPAPWQDILDLAYYSGWRKNEILGLTWEEIDEAGGVIRLSPARCRRT